MQLNTSVVISFWIVDWRWGNVTVYFGPLDFQLNYPLIKYTVHDWPVEMTNGIYCNSNKNSQRSTLAGKNLTHSTTWAVVDRGFVFEILLLESYVHFSVLSRGNYPIIQRFYNNSYRNYIIDSGKSSGGSRGHTRCTPPLSIPILSFWHANFTKHTHIGSCTPPLTRLALPLREILDSPLKSAACYTPILVDLVLMKFHLSQLRCLAVLPNL